MLDDTDKRIILELQKDGRTSYNVIAKKLKLSVPTVFRRVQRLLSEDVISITAIPNPYKVGNTSVAAILFNVDLRKIDSIADKLSAFPEVHMLVLSYGRFDMLCWVQTTSAENLYDLIRKLGKIDGIKDMETLIFAQVTKRTYGWLTKSDLSGQPS